MKLQNICTTALFSAALVSMGICSTGIGNGGCVDLWMKCCERNPVGKRCSDSKNKAECYMACQNGCGDPDSINGKKCRQQCDINR
ncbi:MAG: hypothetical protein JSS66_06900 [Armatimonadetes bacterium]|nr:hypothetical protein [Armatimonadota bacterium]